MKYIRKLMCLLQVASSQNNTSQPVVSRQSTTTISSDDFFLHRWFHQFQSYELFFVSMLPIYPPTRNGAFICRVEE
jgi:hypothetical protein